MVKQMDAGDIVHEHPVEIAPHETGGLLTTRLKYQAALACGDFLSKLHAGTLQPRPQDHGLATFAPTLQKADGHLDFTRDDATQITNRVRAMDPWPGTYCFLNGKRLKVLRVEASSRGLAPGELLAHQGELHVGCAHGSLRLPLVQLEGKKPTGDHELLNGLRGELLLTPPIEGTP